MKAVLAICIIAFALIALAETFGVRQIARADGPLEPSVQNEVDHAVSRAEAWLAERSNHPTNKPPNDLFGTNGLAATEIAIKLISSQKGGGWWITPTNPIPTRIAIDILKGL